MVIGLWVSSLIVKSSTPYEAWSVKKPYVMPFRIFGFIAYAHIPFSQRKKTLDDNSNKCVLLGVSEKSKAYRFFDRIIKKIVVSEDVAFDEQGMLSLILKEIQIRIYRGIGGHQVI